jgi:two-component system response regulator
MGGKTILIVEDDPPDEALTLRALMADVQFNEVISVRHGAQAIDYLFGLNAYSGRPVPALPTVMFLDLKLPKVDGLEVLRRVRSDARTKRLPVVILSSSDDAADRLAAYGAGANAFVTKPTAFGEFARVIQDTARFWLTLNQVPPGDWDEPSRVT